MGKRDDLIAQYAEDLSGKCGVTPDIDLLTKVTIGCGPSIYSADSALVAGSVPTELETLKKNFLIKKLGLSDADGLDDAIAAVGEKMKGVSRKNRLTVYYLLAQQLGKLDALR